MPTPSCKLSSVRDSCATVAASEEAPTVGISSVDSPSEDEDDEEEEEVERRGSCRGSHTIEKLQNDFKKNVFRDLHRPNRMSYVPTRERRH